MHALGPAGLDRAGQPAPASACRTSLDAATASANSSAPGGSMSSIRCDGRSLCPAVTSVGWYSTARWLANQISVGLSPHSA